MGQSNSSKRNQTDIQTFLDKEKDKFIQRIENPTRQNASLDNFELIRTIGTGSFGKLIIKKEEKQTINSFFFFFLNLIYFCFCF